MKIRSQEVDLRTIFSGSILSIELDGTFGMWNFGHIDRFWPPGSYD